VGNGGMCCVAYSDNSGSNPVETCITSGQTCAGTYISQITCNSVTDCSSGTICCLTGNGAANWSTDCRDPSTCKDYVGQYVTVFGYQLCDVFLSGASECLKGTCQADGMAPGLYSCQ
jgi:hypothetical protein